MGNYNNKRRNYSRDAYSFIISWSVSLLAILSLLGSLNGIGHISNDVWIILASTVVVLVSIMIACYSFVVNRIEDKAITEYVKSSATSMIYADVVVYAIVSFVLFIGDIIALLYYTDGNDYFSYLLFMHFYVILVPILVVAVHFHPQWLNNYSEESVKDNEDLVSSVKYIKLYEEVFSDDNGSDSPDKKAFLEEYNQVKYNDQIKGANKSLYEQLFIIQNPSGVVGADERAVKNSERNLCRRKTLFVGAGLFAILFIIWSIITRSFIETLVIPMLGGLFIACFEQWYNQQNSISIIKNNSLVITMSIVGVVLTLYCLISSIMQTQTHRIDEFTSVFSSCVITGFIIEYLLGRFNKSNLSN